MEQVIIGGRGFLTRREQGGSRQQRLPRLRDDLRPGAAATDVAAADVRGPPSSVAFSPDSQRLLAASPDYLMQWDLASGDVLSRSSVPGLRDLTWMTFTEDGRWLAISHPRSLTVLDSQTLLVAVADMRLPTEAPTDTFADAFAVAARQDHQLLVGTGSLLASIEMDPEQWKSAACQVAARQLTKE